MYQEHLWSLDSKLIGIETNSYDINHISNKSELDMDIQISRSWVELK